MRIKRTIAASAGIAMLAFTLSACESEEKTQTKAEAKPVATEQPKKVSANIKAASVWNVGSGNADGSLNSCCGGLAKAKKTSGET